MFVHVLQYRGVGGYARWCISIFMLAPPVIAPDRTAAGPVMAQPAMRRANAISQALAIGGPYSGIDYCTSLTN